MVSQRKIFQDFLDSIPDEKLQNFVESHGALFKSFDARYRLDYQGLNKDKKEIPHIHRLYVQPLGRSSKCKSKSHRDDRNQDNSSITARCHASNKAKPSEIRDALVKSYNDDDTMVFYAPLK